MARRLTAVPIPLLLLSGYLGRLDPHKIAEIGSIEVAASGNLAAHSDVAAHGDLVAANGCAPDAAFLPRL